jgi:hypothetical protein
MDRTGDITPSPPLLALGEEDAALCADGFCEVPATGKAEAADAD